MNTNYINCLSFEQLQSYSLHKSDKEEHAHLYMHISTCELCACAVNGFTAISFTSADVDAIDHQIDMKTNAMHANPLTFAHVLIACVSIATIFGFYFFANSFSDNKSTLAVLENVKPITLPLVEEIIIVVEPEVVSVPKENFKNETVVENEVVEKLNILVEPMESITPDLIHNSVKTSDVFVENVFNANVIYIYDLKVTNYNALYFNYQINIFEIKGHTPPNKENKESANTFFEKDFEQTIAADKVLKAGLAHFNKGKYEKALGEFQILLDANPNDINSLFYSAVSYYHIGKYDRCIKNLEAVLKSANNTFHPEAKWNLALSNLKIGEKAKAKQLLIEIVNEKGFYSKRALDKLKGL